ncbi:MAG TPA: hypothetical protein DDW52_24065 [Planctomycetaceae bacterium]|nr:hypothetical protein [Planctomycetaceae bacterium]
MHQRAILLLILMAALGCKRTAPPDSNGDAPESYGEGEVSVSDSPDTEKAADTDQAADAEFEAMAKQMGLTVAQLQMKKRMLMDSGLSDEEIAKTLTMGGDPLSLFKDDVKSNAEPPMQIRDLSFFLGEADQEVKLDNYIGKSSVVLVFTRGYSGGMICPFCSMQISQLVANYDNFIERDTKVLIVYPGSVEHLDNFAAAVTKVDLEKADIAAVKWPVLLDPDLKAVGLLEIEADLAKPSTFIIDKVGNLVFSYVGANRTDRPSVKAILNQLDTL